MSDLETLSWIAGAGSFVIAAAALAIALGDRFGQAEHISRSASAAEPNRASAETSTAAGEDRVVIELTTPRIRIAKRLVSPFIGAGAVLLFMACLWALASSFTREDVTIELNALAILAGVGAVFTFFVYGGEGKDLLIVDRIGVTVVDKRWIRAVDRTFSIPWELMRQIRVEPGASCTLVVEFKSRTVEGVKLDALKRRIGCETYHDRCVVARLYLASGGAERTQLLHRTHEALARFGGNAYSK
ncbi:hypothetical protein [Streptosporangium sandarakinum]|uniref:hypothetical protein n=1 Tax=Streptosporangium sandarakinum TaxID=1260955 RepID=UPI00342C71B8